MSSHSGLATVSAMWSANDSGQSRSVSDALRLVIPSGVTASSIRSSGPLLGIHNGRRPSIDCSKTRRLRHQLGNRVTTRATATAGRAPAPWGSRSHRPVREPAVRSSRRRHTKGNGVTNIPRYGRLSPIRLTQPPPPRSACHDRTRRPEQARRF
jgi:hypothetical protein